MEKPATIFLRKITISAVVNFICISGFVSAQSNSIDEAIENYRKGEIIIRAKPGERIIVEQLKHDFWFGCAISSGVFEEKYNPTEIWMYKTKFLENFNSAVTENAVKWLSMEPIRGEVNYSTVDSILAWTEKNEIPLRAHNLFWGIPQFIQPWVKQLDNEMLEKTIRQRAETITARYKGRFAEYDLNNEMIHGNYYEEKLGPEITKKMAEWGLKGDSAAKFYLNDYDILTGVKLDDYMAHIRKLQVQGVPIAGIGVQGHLHGDSFDRVQLKRALDSLAKFKLPIRVTEFNMPGQRSKFYEKRDLRMTPEEELQKARDIVDYYRICFAHPAVEGIMMWGFWEGANWIKASSLFKRDWTPTPAAEAYKSLIFKEWWTKEVALCGEEGFFSVFAFYGKYRITVGNRSKEVYLSKNKKVMVVELE
jgi:GH35 family endo-1,4-beta-xylanase